MVGVIGGIAVAVGDGGVNVGMTFVFAAVGVSIDRGVAQDTRIKHRSKSKNCFMEKIRHGGAKQTRQSPTC
jgi:hypothetical protein